MKSLRMLVLTLTFATAFAAVASAQGTMRMERRELRQDARIHEGVRSGELTRGEAMHLRMGERHIDRMEARARCNDGRMSVRERIRIDRAQNLESRRIYRLKHNGNTRAY